MVQRLTPLLSFLLVACVATQDRQQAEELQYDCDDLVVIGRIVTLDAQALRSLDPHDPLPGWQSKYNLGVRIKRVVKGSERRSVVSATGISHAQIRDDKDFLIVMSPDADGGFILQTAALMQYRPRLGEACS